MHSSKTLAVTLRDESGKVVGFAPTARTRKHKGVAYESERAGVPDSNSKRAVLVEPRKYKVRRTKRGYFTFN